MDRTRFLRRRAAAALLLGAFLASSPAHAREIERGVESAHQPAVQRTDFVFDIQGDVSGALPPAEQARLIGWFDALRLGYGDHVSLADARGHGSRALHDAVADVVGRYGLLIEGEAPATAGDAPAGGLRVVVSRSVAGVPGCPSWRDRAEANFTGGLSDNYGCAMARNLAAMVADPRDLVEGRDPRPDPTSGVSSKAIKAYTERAPTGASGLQSVSAGGN